MASALGKAKRVGTTAAKKSTSPIIVAQDVRDFANPDNVLFTRDQVVEAIDGYAEGDSLEKQGKALKTLHRGTVEAAGLHSYVQMWSDDGNFPEHNPKLVTNDAATGTIITYMVIDKEVKIDDGQFAVLSNLIGAKNAEENTVKRDEISFDQDKLETVITDGPAKGKTILDLIDEGISEKFAAMGQESLMDGLFQIKPKFTTKKTLIKKGLALVGKNPQKLADFVAATNAIVSLRPGNGGAKDE